MKRSIMPYLLRGLSSDGLRSARHASHRFRRKLSRQAPTVLVFLKADDPYSYLLVQALESVEARFAVSLRFHIVQSMDPEMYPRLDMWHQYARYDASRLAALYGYDFPENNAIPVIDEQTTDQLALELVRWQDDRAFLRIAKNLMHAYWFEGSAPEPDSSQCLTLQQSMAHNEQLLAQTGHYSSAMLFFEGEWYWGLDRLDHLESRLIQEGLSRQQDEVIYFDRTYRDFCKRSPVKPASDAERKPLTLYWSARSPYSYIGLEQAVKLTENYDIPLDIKPVLPMVMRGMPVPHNKKLYIFLDTKREASKLGLPYGYVADPLGAAVERCYALVDYARQHNRLLDFLLSFARGVNAEGIRAETNRGMKVIVQRAGLDWHAAKQRLHDQSWRLWAQSNLDQMLEKGCWGVPTLCYDTEYFWGQDRFGLIETCIREDLRTTQA